ncbi:Hypothetical_protein [Hexamita inflata]|uniref:Hypothetical_protein n=1 Tax=Hexamita inflata TaxID=28002 RepID=A0AA86TVC8_9EUKA|nr:Hypothetical protein HINF_LOCUS17656 [Hexamita inflata]
MIKNGVKKHGICHLLIREFCMMEHPYKRNSTSLTSNVMQYLRVSKKATLLVLMGLLGIMILNLNFNIQNFQYRLYVKTLYNYCQIQSKVIFDSIYDDLVYQNVNQ